MINVNKVYRTVLSILNKEQRGVLTPEQFDRIAREVQLDMVEETLYEYNKAMYRKKAGQYSMEYGDIPKHLKEKLDALATRAVVTPVLNAMGLTVNLASGLDSKEIYRILNVRKSSDFSEIEEVSKRDLNYILRSPLTAPSNVNPIYVVDDDLIRIRPTTMTGSIQVDFLKKPRDPKWAFTPGNFNNYVYDPNNSVDFDLHLSEEPTLVSKILAYVGVTIRDEYIAQAASAETAKRQTLENS